VIFTEDPFRSNTLLEAVHPLLKALLEVFFCEILQYISYSSIVVADYLKMSLWVVRDYQEEKKSHVNRYGERYGYRATAVFLDIKKLPHRQHTVTGRSVMIEKPSISNVCLNAQNPFHSCPSTSQQVWVPVQPW